MRARWRTWALSGVLFGTLLVSGCATLQPWERGVLMQRCMQQSLDPLETAMDLHMHRTREAMSGAAAGGGASCGCN